MVSDKDNIKNTQVKLIMNFVCIIIILSLKYFFTKINFTHFLIHLNTIFHFLIHCNLFVYFSRV